MKKVLKIMGMVALITLATITPIFAEDEIVPYGAVKVCEKCGGIADYHTQLVSRTFQYAVTCTHGLGGYDAVYLVRTHRCYYCRNCGYENGSVIVETVEYEHGYTPR